MTYTRLYSVFFVVHHLRREIALSLVSVLKSKSSFLRFECSGVCSFFDSLRYVNAFPEFCRSCSALLVEVDCCCSSGGELLVGTWSSTNDRIFSGFSNNLWCVQQRGSIAA